MAKAGLRGMCMQLAKSGFPPEASTPGAAPRGTFPLVRVNNVSPGPVATEMLASMAAADLAKITAGGCSGHERSTPARTHACTHCFRTLRRPNRKRHSHSHGARYHRR